MVGSQILFGLQQTAAHRPGIRGRVVVQKAVPRFQIKDVVGIQQLHPAADLQGHLPAAAALDALQGALQLGAELVVADGLEHKVERVDLIPADGILCHVGDEHEHHIRVLPADALRRRHTAELWHLNIQKNGVKPGAVRLHKLCSVREGGHVQLVSALLRILRDEPAELRPHGVVVLDHGDFRHLLCLLSCISLPYCIYIYYGKRQQKKQHLCRKRCCRYDKFYTSMTSVPATSTARPVRAFLLRRSWNTM